MDQHLFPPWLDRARPLFGAALILGPVYVAGLLYYGGSPKTTDVGYSPLQPIAYSHALHAGELGIDCRYCHTPAEISAHMPIPSTTTCLNCHKQIAPDSPKLAPLRESQATGLPVRWKKVHDLPDYVYFNHSAHVARGVGCVECHGRVDKMERVRQVETLSMGWCLDCHRNPARHLRPPEAVADMNWVAAEDPEVVGRRLREEYNIHPSTDCSTCHR